MSSQRFLIGGLILVLLAAGWWLVGKRSPLRSKRDAELTKDLFLKVSPDTKDLLLADWRWKVGDAKVFRVSIFGDLFTQTSGGQIYWLDTGTGRYVQVATSAEQWADAVDLRGREWLHWKTLQDLRSRGVKLVEGNVYSWRHPPILGGDESADNVDLIPLKVHVSNAGRVAAAVKDLSPGTKIEKADFEPLHPASYPAQTGGGQGIYNVVINSEEQYSMWPVGQDIPAG